MKRVICCLFACVSLLLVSGCTKEDTYNRDETAGSVENITVEEMQKKVDAKETFAIVFTQSWCGHCKDFIKMLGDYLPSHNVTVYDVVLDEDPIKEQTVKLDMIRKTFPEMDATPSVYYVVDGVKQDELMPGDDGKGITESMFDEWVQKHQIDLKK